MGSGLGGFERARACVVVATPMRCDTSGWLRGHAGDPWLCASKRGLTSLGGMLVGACERTRELRGVDLGDGSGFGSGLGRRSMDAHLSACSCTTVRELSDALRCMLALAVPLPVVSVTARRSDCASCSASTGTVSRSTSSLCVSEMRGSCAVGRGARSLGVSRAREKRRLMYGASYSCHTRG